MRKRFISICIVVILVLGSSMSFAWTRSSTENGDTIYGMRYYSHYFKGYSGFTSATNTAIHNACSTWNNAGAGTLIYRSTQTHDYLPAGWDEGNEIYYEEDGDNRILKKSVGSTAWVAECHSFANRIVGDWTYKINESDIVLNVWYALGSSGNSLIYDVETIMLHELGHAIGLGHSSINTVMYETIDVGRLVRSLSSDDIIGINNIY